MKKLFYLLNIVLLTMASSCGEIKDNIADLDNRLDQLEKKVNTVDGQITAINTSINLLKEVDEAIKARCSELEASNKDLEEGYKVLENANKTLATNIETLREYVDTQLSSTVDWVDATFATLEQYNTMLTDIARLENLIASNREVATNEINDAIASLKISLESWVSEQLTGYYTIAQTDAKIAELEQAIADGDAVFQEQIDELKGQLQSSIETVTAAYQEAIAKAINENNGAIDQQIATEIATVNKRIDDEVAAINDRISILQAQADENSAAIERLMAQIQSLSYIPHTSDGKAYVSEIDGVSCATLDFEVSPKEAVVELAKVWQSAIVVKAVYTTTRAITFIDMPVVEFSADEQNGVISVVASGENLSEEFFAGTQSASVRLSISDGNSSVVSDYIVMVAR